MKPIVVFIFLSAVCAAQTYYGNTPGQMYVWNGGSLMPLYNTEGIACDHWAMWYFREGAPQIPGMQWGSDSGKSAVEVQKAWEESKRIDQAWKDAWRYFGIPYKPDPLTYDNAMGPICITEAAFHANSKTDEAVDEIQKLAGQAKQLIKDVRESINFTNALTGTQRVPSIYQKTQVEEFLDKVEETLKKAQELKEKLYSKTEPSMDYIGGQMEQLRKELAANKVRANQLAKKFPLTDENRPINDIWKGSMVPSWTIAGGGIRTVRFSDNGSTFNYSWDDCGNWCGHSMYTVSFSEVANVTVSQQQDGTWFVELECGYGECFKGTYYSSGGFTNYAGRYIDMSSAKKPTQASSFALKFQTEQEAKDAQRYLEHQMYKAKGFN